MIRLGTIRRPHHRSLGAARSAEQGRDIEVVGEAGTAAETLAMIQKVKPDVLLLDITLPDRSGFDVLADLRRSRPRRSSSCSRGTPSPATPHARSQPVRTVT